MVVAVEHAGAERSPNGVYVEDTVDLSRWQPDSSARIEWGRLTVGRDALEWTVDTPRFDGRVGPLGGRGDDFVRAVADELRIPASAGCTVCRLISLDELWTGSSVRAALHALVRRSSEVPLQPRDRDILLGFGPGLTPATDDLVCGALLAQHALGVQVADALAPEPLARAAAVSTTAVSSTWLRLASEGCAVEPLQDLLASVPATAPWRTALARLLAVGSTTGRSTAIGATLALAGTGDCSMVEERRRAGGTEWQG
jgi:hypothetical protein